MKTFYKDYHAELTNIVNTHVEQYNSDRNSWDPYYSQLPNLFLFCYQFAVSPGISEKVLKKLYVAIRYLISPLDFMPELVYGIDGFKEDLYLIALTLHDLNGQIPQEIIDHYWLLDHSIESFTDEVITLSKKELPEKVKSNVNEFYHHSTPPITINQIKDLLTRENDHVENGEPSTIKSYDGNDIHYAIEHINGPCVVFAGPGSGKTYTIEERVCYLIEHHKVDPENILVTTFTNKAADELVVRIRHRLSHRRDIDEVMTNLTISTIHSLCYSLLKQYKHNILFLRETYAPVEEKDQLLFIYRNSGNNKLDLKKLYQYWRNSRKKGGEPVYHLGLFDYYSDVLRIYNYLSEEVLGAESQTQLLFSNIINNQKPRCIEDHIIASYPKYWELLRKNGILDQSIILSYTESLLKDNQILTRIREKYKYLLVDEYQDTNAIQDRIFNRVSGKDGNLFVVGDDDQSIYRFRGAEVTNITGFTDRHPHTSIVRLNENRRSSQRIVNTATCLIQKNKNRIRKELFSSNEEGDPVAVIACQNIDDQAKKAAEIINDLKENNRIENLSQVAILFRSVKKHGKKFTKTLREYEIDSKITSDKSFFKEELIKGLRQIFDIIKDPELTIKGRLYTAVFKKAEISKKDGIQLVEKWHSNLHADSYKSLLSLYYTILNDTDIIPRLSEDEDSLSNLGLLSEIIAVFEGGQLSGTLIEKLEFLLQYFKMLDGGIDQSELETEDAVQLMTVHKSKGLQFDYVIMANVVEDEFPFPPRLDARQRAKGVILNGPDGRKLEDDESKKSVEEERRIFYVGMTRAAKGLFILTDEDNQSDFIKELGSDVEFSKSNPETTYIPRKINSSSDNVLHLSHSDIYDYTFCPGRFKLRKKYGFKGQAIRPLFAGLSLHRSLEVLHRMLIDGQHINEEILERIFNSSWVAPFGPEPENEKEKIQAIFYDYAKAFVHENDAYKVINTEFPFVTAHSHNVLTGKLDLIQENSDGQIEVVEFKYNKNPMLDEYVRNQLLLYSLAFPERDVKLYAYFLKQRKKSPEAIPDKKEITENVKETFDKIRSKKFEYTPGKKRCEICPVSMICEASEVRRN